jgi:hypothetical protein
MLKFWNQNNFYKTYWDEMDQKIIMFAGATCTIWKSQTLAAVH